tara:strand:+ start:1969 stop:2865 length:897 start_codon:yes stop_codon:yes gene_type:complete
MRKQKVLIIGGSGFLGSHVADILSEKKYEVTIIDTNKSRWIKKEQKFIKGDILNPEKFLHILKKNQYVYNFAAVSDITEANDDAEKTVKINILGLVKLLSLCVKAKVKQYFHASTIYVSGSHGGFYKSSKLSAESYVKEFYKLKGLNYSILRFGTLYGPRSSSSNGLYSIVEKSLKKKKIIYSGNPESMRDYIHIVDAAKVCEKAIRNKEFKNKTIVISGPELFKIKDVLKIISEITGIKKVQYVAQNAIKKHTHYQVTPYSISEEKNFAMKYSDRFNVDFGQGLQNLITELKIKHNF